MCDSPTLTALRRLPVDRLRHIAQRSADIADSDSDKLRADTAARLALFASQACQERLEARLLTELATEHREAQAAIQAFAGSM